jgi:signal transduction histidine kinase
VRRNNNELLADSSFRQQFRHISVSIGSSQMEQNKLATLKRNGKVRPALEHGLKKRAISSRFELAMFRSLRTSTKLFLLCSLFVVSIAVATYGLVAEKQIAIGFVRKELVGTRYLQALQPVYATILTDERKAAPIAKTKKGIDESLDALSAVEADTAGSLKTSESEQALTAALRGLLSGKASGMQEEEDLDVGALAKARNLASRIGDNSNLALDPDLDSYYLQDIVATKMPTLLGQLGELEWSLLRASLHLDAPSSYLVERPLITVRPLLLIGMIRSTLEEIKRDLAAAYRGDSGVRLRQTIDARMNSMISPTESYLTTVTASRGEANDLAAFDRAYATAADGAMSAWSTDVAELNRLLNRRLSNLQNKLRNSLILNGLLAGLSIALAIVTYRQIAGPLKHLRGLAKNVQETKNLDLRSAYGGQDEIGRVGVAFNAMLAELAEAHEREAAEQARTAAMQAELARVSRVTSMGEMAASFAHEINQPLAAVVTNANAGLRWLNSQPPNIEEVRAALKRIISDGQRGSNVLASIRGMLKKETQERIELNVNESIRDVITLSQGALKKGGVSVEAELADGLPLIVGDRIQLQQVFLNLVLNAVEAMTSVDDRPRVLRLRSEPHDSDAIVVSVEDTGTGIDPKDRGRLFETFFTTKPEGLGMGLSICRSIIESHVGRIEVLPAELYGSIFRVFLPIGEAGKA